MEKGVKLKPTYDIGFEGFAETGERFVVVDYQGRKKILIRFDCGMEKNTTSTLIKQGKVKYCKKKHKIIWEVGGIVENRDGTVKGTILAVDLRRKRIKVGFENGVQKTYSTSTLSGKDINDKPTKPMSKGDVFNTNTYGEIVVVEYYNAHKVEVMFEDGVKTISQASSIRLGNVGHPKSGTPEGYTFTNNDGFTGTVIKYHDPYNVDIEWESGHIQKGVKPHNVKRGCVYNPLVKSVVGVGYFGFGHYKPDKAGNGSNYNKTVYQKWQQMIVRCYSEKEQAKPSSRAYKGVKVCDEWHNFQNFARWAEDKEDKFVEGYELDKDLFGDGWLYCPESCTLLPREINGFLSDNYSNKTSGLPDGVNVIEPDSKYPNSKIGYVARCHIKGEREYLGYFDTAEQAGKVYRKAKEAEGRRLAEEYKDRLTESEYNKLKEFTLEYIHRKH